MDWEYRTLQFRTTPNVGVWSRLSDEDIRTLDQMQNEGWEVYQTVNIRGSMGFSAHILFLLRRPRK